MRKRGKSINPNAGIEAKYRARLQVMIAEMQASVVYWLRSSYRQNEPVVTELATDALPSKALAKAVNDLSSQWQSKFDDMAGDLAKYFAKSVFKRSDAQLKKILKTGGITVPFKTTKAMQDVLRSTVTANVGLIKSIPEQYFGQVEGLVMRSVQGGRDLEYLSKELRKRYKITQHRAEFIARDQNNKATAALTRARQLELDITKARWRHSHAGRHPRPSHVRADGKIYDVKKGMVLDGKRTWPGVEPNCRCRSEPVIPGVNA